MARTQPDFQNTQPASIAQLTGQAIDEFRVDNPAEVVSLLRRVSDSSAYVHLSAPNGAACTTVLWAVDASARRLGFDAPASNTGVNGLVDAGEATAVAYLDAIKIQFELPSLMLVHGATGSVLQAPLPSALYRFQRRSSFRVRAKGGATASLRHPSMPEMTLSLRVLDVSVGGCALAVPADVPAIGPGVRIAKVKLELDADTRFETDLTVQHVSGGFAATAPGTRLGCAFGTLDGSAQRTLQRFIDLTQRRQRLLTL
jgi:c-di-GMP-binding flagellar brake protein YcgR